MATHAYTAARKFPSLKELFHRSRRTRFAREARHASKASKRGAR